MRLLGDIFVLRLSEQPFSGLVVEADSTPILLPDMSIMVGMCPLVLFFSYTL